MIGWRWWSGGFTDLSVDVVVATLATQGVTVTPAQQAELTSVAHDGVVRAALLSGARYQLWSGLEFTLSRDLPPAYCWRHPDHRPPVVGCTCGPRVVPRLSDLAEYAANSLKQLAPGGLSGRHVFGRVKTSGPTLPGVGHNQDGACCRIAAQFGESCLRADPPRTVRAANIKLIGPLYLSPAFANANDVDAFAHAFRVKVIPATGRGDFSEWLGGLRGKPYELPTDNEHLNHLLANVAIATQEYLAVRAGEYGESNAEAFQTSRAQLVAALQTGRRSQPDGEWLVLDQLTAPELVSVALSALAGTPVEAELVERAAAVHAQ